MNKRISVIFVLISLMATMLVTVTPVNAMVPTSTVASAYDIGRVKVTVERAYWSQSSWTRHSLCKSYRINPQARIFVRLALVAYRMPGISAREAARGVIAAFDDLCY